MSRASRTSSTAMAQQALASVALEPQAFSRLAGSSLGSVLQSDTSTVVESAREPRSGRAPGFNALDRIAEGTPSKFAPPSRSTEGPQIKTGNNGMMQQEQPKDRRLSSTVTSPNHFNDSAGLASFHSTPRMKRIQERNAQLSAEAKFLGTGTRKFNNHPVATSVVGKDAFNNDILKQAGVVDQSADEAVRALYANGDVAGIAMWNQPQTHRKKQVPGVAQSEVDRVVFNHDTFERQEGHDIIPLDAAGSQSWRSMPGLGLDATLASGIPRSGRKHRPPSEAGTTASCTNDVHPKKSFWRVSPNHVSNVGAVVFGQDTKQKVENIHRSPEFRAHNRGAAGQTTHSLGRTLLKDSCRCLPDDGASVCSTADSTCSPSRSALSSPAKSPAKQQQRFNAPVSASAPYATTQ